MKRLHIYFLLLSALLIHLTVLSHIRLLGATPDLMLIIVIFCGLFFGPGAGLEYGLAAGILKDMFTSGFFGMNIVACAITGLAAGILNDKFYKESKFTEFILAVSFTAFCLSLHYLLVRFVSTNLALTFPEYLVTSVLPVSVYTGLIALPVFPKLIDLYGLKHLEELL